MNRKLRGEAEQIMWYAIGRVLPDEAVVRALSACELSDRIYLAAVGKAAWQMAHAAVQYLKTPVEKGVVVTKYGHVRGDIPGVRCFEGGHPIPDENSLAGTQAILDMTAALTQRDQVLFLVSGGGSALFEKPLVPLPVLQDLNRQLLAVGASIAEINTLRKRLSAVKGGRFARWCEPARMEAIILSDVLGDPLDLIASGPAALDRSTSGEALNIVEKYHLDVTEEVLSCLREETPRELRPVNSHVIGSVGQLCLAAAEKCRELGYETTILTDRLCCEAREAGRFLAAIAASGLNAGGGGPVSGSPEAEESSPASRRSPAVEGGSSVTRRSPASEGCSPASRRSPAAEESSSASRRSPEAEESSPAFRRNPAAEESGPISGPGCTAGKRAYIVGGECVVRLRGSGLGGRNQELALAAAEGLAGISGTAVFSVGSDGTDGPTDAAGGYVDGESLDALKARGIRLQDALACNDSYHALDAIGGLLKTGPTGTNVNDFSVVLMDFPG